MPGETIILADDAAGRVSGFVSALAAKYLVRLVLNGNRVSGEERLLADQNVRIRSMTTGPEGALYVLTDGMGGKILRLSKR